jgi:hypothetical protein
MELIPRDDLDLTDLSHAALLAYVLELRREMTGLRATLHAAGGALYEIRRAAETLRANRDRLIDETRALRAHLMKLDAAA